MRQIRLPKEHTHLIPFQKGRLKTERLYVLECTSGMLRDTNVPESITAIVIRFGTIRSINLLQPQLSQLSEVLADESDFLEALQKVSGQVQGIDLRTSL
jgi:hypothetical protein